MMHDEKHFLHGDLVRDVVIGMSDGLTVPFALAAGLSGAVSSSKLIVTAGIAEIAAGAVAMGLGAYLAAKSEAEHYASELAREHAEVRDMREHEERETREVFAGFGVPASATESILDALRKDPDSWVQFMMRFELGLEKPALERMWKGPAAIAGAYIVGGTVPLAPYMMIKAPLDALGVSVLLTLFALALFGALKSHFTGAPKLRGALQTTLVGAVAAGVAFALARAIS